MAAPDTITDPDRPVETALLDELESNARRILAHPDIHATMTVVMAREAVQILDRLRSEIQSHSL